MIDAILILMIRPLPCLALLSLCAFCLSVSAEEKPAPEEGAKKPETEKKEDAKPGDKKPEEKSKEEKSKEEKPKESKGSVTIAGQEIKYVAKTGMLPLLKEDGTGERAHVFYVYYAAVDADGKPLAGADATKRPITFCFNGGPGSSAVWLHFGGFGPRKVELDPQGLPRCGARAHRAESEFDPRCGSDLVVHRPRGALARAVRRKARRASSSGA